MSEGIRGSWVRWSIWICSVGVWVGVCHADESSAQPVPFPSSGAPAVTETEGSRPLPTAENPGQAGPGADLNSHTLDYLQRGLNRQRIEAALATPSELEFIDTELIQVLSYLSERYQFSIVPDTTRMTDFGVGLDTPVSLVISDVSLRSALELILDPLKLDYVIQQEVLQITTREYADQLMEVRVYELRHLPMDITSEDLARVIQRTIQPDLWRTTPPSRAPGAVIHDVNPTLISNDNPQPSPAVNKSPTQSQIPTQTADTDTSLLAAIEALPGCLVIRQSQRAHREIEALLEQFQRKAATDASKVGAPESVD